MMTLSLPFLVRICKAALLVDDLLKKSSIADSEYFVRVKIDSRRDRFSLDFGGLFKTGCSKVRSRSIGDKA